MKYETILVFAHTLFIISLSSNYDAITNNSLHHTDKRIFQLVIYIFLDSCWLYFATVETFWMYNNNYVQNWTIRVNTFRKGLHSINVKDWRVRYTLYYNILMIKSYNNTICYHWNEDNCFDGQEFNIASNSLDILYSSVIMLYTYIIP